MPKASKTVQVWVGTRKGAFRFSSLDRRKWKAEGPHFKGEEVHHVSQDPREPDLFFASAGTAWFGSHLHRSEDGGRTWVRAEEGLTVEGCLAGETLKRVWHIAPGAADDPGVVWLGADPGALFRSADRGKTWTAVSSLTAHPTRARWMPGAGGLMVHSIQPLGKGRIVVGISAAGAFRSSDSGKTWEPFNGGVLADFQPEKYPEVGQCVHKLKAHPNNPDALYQQNHCGVFQTKFSAAKWADRSKGLPTRFGFALAVPAAENRTMLTIPIKGAEERYVPEGKLRVARSRDNGKSWQFMTRGLPQKNAFSLILREAMASDDRDEAGIYFGTTGGTVYYSRNGGDSWQELAANLPPVYSVTVSYATK